jgi:threonine aldolase
LESYLILSVCLSKLGAPIGSVLLADKATIHRALRIRKILGGGMQSGYLAAAGIYALDNNIERLSEDHEELKKLPVLKKLSWVASVEPVETNILIFSLTPNCNEKNLIEVLKQKTFQSARWVMENLEW